MPHVHMPSSIITVSLCVPTVCVPSLAFSLSYKCMNTHTHTHTHTAPAASGSSTDPLGAAGWCGFDLTVCSEVTGALLLLLMHSPLQLLRQLNEVFGHCHIKYCCFLCVQWAIYKRMLSQKSSHWIARSCLNWVFFLGSFDAVVVCGGIPCHLCVYVCF